MRSLVEILCCLDEEVGKLVNLLDISSINNKLRAFTRYPCFWNRYLMPWR